MARKTGRNLKEERHTRKVRRMEPIPQTLFLPDYPQHVKAIAQRGLSDSEMAELFGISPELMESWKAQYPSFSRAIEEGRTELDELVIAALFTAATGLDPKTRERARIRKQKAISLGEGDFTVVDLEEDLPAQVQAQRYWLNNRAPKFWGDKTQIGGDRSPGAAPIGVRDETKQEVIASILNFIQPKPDNPDAE